MVNLYTTGWPQNIDNEIPWFFPDCLTFSPDLRLIIRPKCKTDKHLHKLILILALLFIIFIIISIVDKDGAFSSMNGKIWGCNWPFSSEAQPLMRALWCRHIAPCGDPLSILLLNPMKSPWLLIRIITKTYSWLLAQIECSDNKTMTFWYISHFFVQCQP